MEREDGYLIGDGLRIPWKQSEDMRNFKRLTMGHAVIVGKTTAVTLGYGERIPGRQVLVITRTPEESASEFIRTRPAAQAPPLFFKNLTEAIERAKEMGVKKVFIAGGSSIFEEGSMYANEAHLTQVFVPKSVQFKSPIVVNKKAIDEMRSRLRRAELNYFEADANNQYPYAFENLLIGV